MRATWKPPMAFGVVWTAACGGPVSEPDAAVTSMIDAASGPDAFTAREDDAFTAPGPDAFMELVDAASSPDAFAGEPCATRGASETVVCGMCGTQTRFCTSALLWEYSDCDGEHGVCEAGTTMDVACGPGGTVTSRCTDECVFEAMGECSSALWSCAMPLDAESREGTVSVSSDTSAGGAGPLDLGMTCGPAITDPAMRPAQVVVRYVVPGVGMRLLRFTTANGATPGNFDTLIQLRRDCMAVPTVREGSCFDDGVPPATPPPMVSEYRTLGNATVTGGETLYFIVTGYGSNPPTSMTHVVEGPFQLDITVGDPTPPSITSASLETRTGASGSTAVLSVTGTDTSTDVLGARVTLLGAGDAPLDRNGSGMVDATDDITVTLPGITTSPFTTMEEDTFLYDEIVRLGSSRARVRLYDAVGSESSTIAIDITGTREVSYGDPCDAMNVCVTGLECTASVCAETAETRAACTAATTLTLSGTPATTRVTGTLAMGASTVPRPCAGAGVQTFYRVTVPAGAFDLVASTINPGTAMTLDTVVYALSNCGDVTSGPPGACADDALGERRANLVVQDIAAGTYTIAVSAYSALAAAEPYALDVTLRPVLMAGAMCDPTGVANRCAGSVCSAAGMCM